MPVQLIGLITPGVVAHPSTGSDLRWPQTGHHTKEDDQGPVNTSCPTANRVNLCGERGLWAIFSCFIFIAQDCLLGSRLPHCSRF